MAQAQIENPKGAFGNAGAESTGTAVGLPYTGGQTPEVYICRNASTAFPIQKGMAVLLATVGPGSTGGVAVRTNSSTAADPLFYGVALTSAGLNTELTTVVGTTGLGAVGTDYCQVAVSGVVPALMSSASAAGTLVGYVASTGTTATGTTYAGSLGALAATAAGTYSVAGIVLTAATTGTTGYLTTAGPRGLVLLQKSLVGSISTA